MKNTFIPLLIIFLINQFNLVAQESPEWDNPAGNNWPVNFKVAEIESSIDDSIQRLIFYQANSDSLQPLIISFHTWSGDYTQDDPIAKLAAKRNWNYIHPDFRGQANHPQACGSKFVIADIEDAIDFAIKNLSVDQEEIHIIGVSGGGYTALVSYLKVNRPVKSFSVWVPISDLESWYWESFGRKNKYANDLVKISGGKDLPVFSDLKVRSPLYMDFGHNLHKSSKISIYTGIHDGYTGSVPITQSINFYNKLIKSFDAKKSDCVNNREIIALLTKQYNPELNDNLKIGERQIHLYKNFETVTLTVFEGTHEMLPEEAIKSVIDEN